MRVKMHNAIYRTPFVITMITMILSTHSNPIIVDELLSSEQFGVDDAALMLLINSFSLLLHQSAV